MFKFKKYFNNNNNNNNEKELEILIHTFRIYRQDIGMEFGIEKYALLLMKRGKHHLTDRIELPN